jgi:hypothetical protein
LEFHTSRLESWSQWTLKQDGAYTLVHHTWVCQQEIPFQTYRLRMNEGAKGLAQHIGVRLLEWGNWPTPNNPFPWVDPAPLFRPVRDA